MWKEKIQTQITLNWYLIAQWADLKVMIFNGSATLLSFVHLFSGVQVNFDWNIVVLKKKNYFNFFFQSECLRFRIYALGRWSNRALLPYKSPNHVHCQIISIICVSFWITVQTPIRMQNLVFAHHKEATFWGR